MTRPRDFLAILSRAVALAIFGAIALTVIAGMARVHTGEVVLR